MTKNKYDLIIIGGGASGLMAAGIAGNLGKKVLLLEKNRLVGEKLKITGGGRCNITNAEYNQRIFLSRYGKAQQFLFSSFSQFSPQDTFNFFEKIGLPLVTQARQRVFPQSEKAPDVVKVLEKYTKDNKVEIKTNTRVEKIITKNKKIEKVLTNKGEFLAKSFILATGGKSHPQTGSTGDGFVWLSQLGHAVQQPTPTLVPLSIKEDWVKGMPGIAIDSTKVTVFVNDKRQLKLNGKILFTHFGLSGPLILNASAKISELLKKGKVTGKIELYPDIDLGTLDKKITKIFDDNKNKAFKNVIKEIVPPGTEESISKLVEDIDPESKINSITKEQRKKLAHLLKSLPITIQGLMGYDRAIIADGGVSIKEIDGKTMSSKLYNNLYITGDLLHIVRPSGGYSLQLCWTTAYVAATHA